MKLVFPKLLIYSSLLLVSGLAEFILLLKLLLAPGKPSLGGLIFLTIFVGAQLLLAGLGITGSFRRRSRDREAD
jgi:hypothetical protein